MKVTIIFVLVALTAVLARDPMCPDQEEDERALIFPHESDETKFYICATNGTLTEFQCTEGLVFDTEVSQETLSPGNINPQEIAGTAVLPNVKRTAVAGVQLGILSA